MTGAWAEIAHERAAALHQTVAAEVETLILGAGGETGGKALKKRTKMTVVSPVGGG